MSVSFNKAIIAGNLTRDVELRYIPSGTAVADVSVAVNERRKQGEEYVDDVQFIDVTLWARNAEVASEYCQKGSAVLIEGRLVLDQWDAEDGSKRSKLKVVAQRFQMLGGRPSEQSEPGPDKNPQEAPVGSGGGNEDIPF